jgi:hypothetical protein
MEMEAPKALAVNGLERRAEATIAADTSADVREVRSTGLKKKPNRQTFERQRTSTRAILGGENT